MARITLFTFPVTGHNAPLVPLVRELVGRAHAVRVATSRAFATRFADAGAHVEHYAPSAISDLVAPSENFLAVAGHLAGTTERSLLAWAVDELRRAPADVVLVDSMAPWGRLAAELTGTPCVTSCSSFVITPRLGANLQAAADVARRLPEGIRGLAEIARSRSALRHRFGVDCGGPMRLLSNRSPTTIVHTSAELHPPIGALGRTVHFVGASAAAGDAAAGEPGGALGELLREAADGAPLAYVSLGTIYHHRVDFLRRCAAALAGAGWRVVVSAGSPDLLTQLGRLPAGTAAEVLPPQLPILDRASLFVTHAGLNSVHEALWRGVPMLTHPQAADQPIVAARLARLGAGIRLPGREPSAADIEAGARQLMASDAARRAASLGAGLAALGGAAAAADLTLAAATGPR
ncbi:MAG: glycosyltransferase [Patulibacter minatonensis]